MEWRIPFFRHDLGAAEIEALTEVLEGDILTTGNTTAEFERRMSELLGRRHVLGVTSCTGAMHMALMALDIGEGDEVITTPMSFIATATAILEAGAVPVFVDVEPDTGNLDASMVEEAITQRTRAILPVHLYGHLCDMTVLKDIANRHNLHLIEDAAHCVEGDRDGIRPGDLSDAVCFSFYATKNLTCGEGGAIAFDDDDMLERLTLLRLHGMTKNGAERFRDGYSHWDMTILGWKYNMSNIEAALLLPQFDRVERNLTKRRILAERYREALEDVPNLQLPVVRESTGHAWHVFTVWTDGVERDSVLAHLKNERIGAVVNYRAIHLMTYFQEKYGYQRGAFPNAERIGDATISLPFYPNMPLDHVDIVAEELRTALTN